MSDDDSAKQTSDGQQNISPSPFGSTENKAGEEVEASGNATEKTNAETRNPQKPPWFHRFMHKHFPDATPHDHWTLLFTAVIAFSTLVYTVVSVWTLIEIRSGGVDTHNLALAAATQATHTEEIAQAADNQVDAANEISDAADSFSETAEIAVEEFRKAAADSVATSKRAGANAERAITEASRNAQVALRVSERPYVTFENIRFDPALDATKNPSIIKYDMHNSGRSPALKLRKEISGFIDDVKIRSAPSTGDGFLSEVIIAADRSVTSSETLTMDAFTFIRVTGGKAKLSLKGSFDYTDIFKDTHSTTFCAAWDNEAKEWRFCPGNDVN